MVTLEGTRPMLVEIQALVDRAGPAPAPVGGPGRDRLAMLLAVLHRHAGVACMDQDVFVNAVGGVRISAAGGRPGGDAGHHLQPAGQGAAARLPGLWRSGAGW